MNEDVAKAIRAADGYLATIGIIYPFLCPGCGQTKPSKDSVGCLYFGGHHRPICRACYQTVYPPNVAAAN